MSRNKLPEGYQSYDQLVEKFKEEYGNGGLISVNAVNTPAGESVLTTLRVEVLDKDKVIATSVVNCIDADSDDSSKAESKAIRRALCRLPGFSSVDLEAGGAYDSGEEEEEETTSRRSRRTKKKSRTSARAEAREEEPEEEAEESEEEAEEEEAPKARSRTRGARSKELLKKYGKRG